jgi:mono/diheme cytochrome c family protein
MKWLRRLGIVVGVLVLVVALGGAGVYAMTESRRTTTYTVPTETPLAAAADSAALARGERIATVLTGCNDCHRPDFGGGVVIDDPAVGTVHAANLTTGKGGVLAKYDDATLERAIRHGIGHDGRNLMVMPSKEYQHLADDDVAALIAYIRKQAPVDREHPPVRIGPVIRVMWAAGKVYPADAAVIRHDEKHLATAPRGNSEEVGRYLAANGCSGCHGTGYSGGPIPGAPPDWKPAANLTPTGIGRYSLADFTRILREGKRPDGTAVDTLMKVSTTKKLSDEEIESLYRFLRTLPPTPYGNR